MITKKTVFVLGAGASAPYGFPTSAELRTRIIKEGGSRLGGLRGDNWDREEFTIAGNKLALKFKNSNVNSIDRFLNEQEPNDVIFGKILIMAFIRDCEKHSKFAEDIKDPKLDWYKQFYNHLIRGVKSFEELSFDNITIITFNYDRSFEYFLYLSIRNTYHINKVSDEQVMNLMRTLKIHHVFGKVEDMIWDSPGIFTVENTRRVYCELNYDYWTLIEKKNNIKIINEVKAESYNYKEIIQDAEDVFFLGFGFLEENMEILGAPYEKRSDVKTRYFGTAWGCSKEIIERYYKQNFGNANSVNNILDCDCCTLLRNHLY